MLILPCPRHSLLRQRVQRASDKSKAFNLYPVVYAQTDKAFYVGRVLRFWPVQNLLDLLCFWVSTVLITDIPDYLNTRLTPLRFLSCDGRACEFNS